MSILKQAKERTSVGTPKEFEGIPKVKIEDLKKNMPLDIVIHNAIESKDRDGKRAVWIKFTENGGSPLITWTSSGGVPEMLLDEIIQDVFQEKRTINATMRLRVSRGGFDVLEIVDRE